MPQQNDIPFKVTRAYADAVFEAAQKSGDDIKTIQRMAENTSPEKKKDFFLTLGKQYGVPIALYQTAIPTQEAPGQEQKAPNDYEKFLAERKKMQEPAAEKAAMRGRLQKASYDWADEIGGVVNWLTSKLSSTSEYQGATLSDFTNMYRQETQKIAKERPEDYARGAEQGSAISTLPIVAASTGAGSAAIAGGLAGGLSAAGASQDESLGEVAGDVLGGTAKGAAINFAAFKAAGLAGKVAGAGARLIDRSLGSVARRAGLSAGQVNRLDLDKLRSVSKVLKKAKSENVSLEAAATDVSSQLEKTGTVLEDLYKQADDVVVDGYAPKELLDMMVKSVKGSKEFKSPKVAESFVEKINEKLSERIKSGSSLNMTDIWNLKKSMAEDINLWGRAEIPENAELAKSFERASGTLDKFVKELVSKHDAKLAQSLKFTSGIYGDLVEADRALQFGVKAPFKQIAGVETVKQEAVAPVAETSLSGIGNVLKLAKGAQLPIKFAGGLAAGYTPTKKGTGER